MSKHTPRDFNLTVQVNQSINKDVAQTIKRVKKVSDEPSNINLSLLTEESCLKILELHILNFFKCLEVEEIFSPICMSLHVLRVSYYTLT